MLIFFSAAVKQEVRDRSSGALETFARRNHSGTGLHDHSRHRSSGDMTLSKDTVSGQEISILICYLFIFIF